jgi:hypothetical protein
LLNLGRLVHRVAGNAAQLERQFRHRSILVIVHHFSFVNRVYRLEGATCHTHGRHGGGRAAFTTSRQAAVILTLQPMKPLIVDLRTVIAMRFVTI